MKERLANVIYAIFTIVAFIFVGSAFFVLFDGGGDNDSLAIFIILLIPSLISYGIGWAIRYIITGEKNSFILTWFLSATKDEVKPQSIATIAALPVYDYVDGDSTFSCTSNSEICDDDEVNTIAGLAAFAYQFFVYILMIEQRFGVGVARIAEEHIIVTLNRGSEEVDLGDGLKTYIAIIRTIFYEDPIEIELDDKLVKLPKEYNICWGMLYSLPSSPYHAKKDKDNQVDIPDDVQDKFIRLLQEARDLMIEKYEPIIFSDRLIIDENSAIGVDVEDAIGRSG